MLKPCAILTQPETVRLAAYDRASDVARVLRGSLADAARTPDAAHKVSDMDSTTAHHSSILLIALTPLLLHIAIGVLVRFIRLVQALKRLAFCAQLLITKRGFLGAVAHLYNRRRI